MDSSLNILNILNQQEINNLYALPKFSKEERPYFFSIGDIEQTYIKRLLTTDAKIWFILQLGYFRAKKRFFDIDYSKSYQDLRYIRGMMGGVDFNNGIPDKKAQARYRKKILEITGCQAIDQKARSSIQKFLREAARRNLKPRAIFSEVLEYFKCRNIELLDYSSLCNLIGAAIEAEHKRLYNIVRRNSNSSINETFTEFLRNGDNDYGFSFIKRDAKNLRFKEVGEELLRHEILAKVYPSAAICVSKFRLSQQNIKYLASLATHYKLGSLRSFPKSFSSVIICCYVYFRFQKSSDFLVDAFQSYVSKIKNKSADYAKNEIFNQRKSMKIDMEKIAILLETFTDKSIPDDATFADVKDKVFKVVPAEEIQLFTKFIKKDFVTIDSFKWDFYTNKHIAFKKNLRPILKSFEFYANSTDDPLIIAIEQFKDFLDNKQKPENLPTGFIPNNLISQVTVGNTLDLIKYELILYFQIARRLEARTLFVRNSTKYLNLTEDLITDNQWLKRDEYLKLLPYEQLSKTPIEMRDELEKQLESKIVSVNENIKNGMNEDIIIKLINGESRWTLPYKKREVDETSGVFDLLQPVNICDIVSYVHQKTGFLECFEHIQPRFSKSASDPKYLSACLIAFGSNLGLQKIAEIADINLNTLTTTYRNYFQVDSINDANQRIIDSAVELPAYNYFNVHNSDLVHAGADGQKFGMKYKSQFARHSPKYFHTGVGVVAYSLIANHFPINALTIGAHDHESHFLFDLIFNNKTSIDPSLISTDTHGINHINFILLHMFGRRFAPRFKNIHKKFSDLKGFKNLDSYQSLLIRPQKQIDWKLIETEWDNIIKILLSLALKETSQSIIVRKLSSHKFSDRTKRAIWELDAVVKSIYLLDYLDNKYLRQDVFSAQNRTESYHQLRRTVSNIAGGKLVGTTQAEIEIWNECSRLLTNCIIFYNTDILSRILEKSGHNNEIIGTIKKISPVAWQHINFLGKYVFRDESFEFDIDALIENIDLNKLTKAA